MNNGVTLNSIIEFHINRLYVKLDSHPKFTDEPKAVLQNVTKRFLDELNLVPVPLMDVTDLRNGNHKTRH